MVIIDNSYMAKRITEANIVAIKALVTHIRHLLEYSAIN